MRQGETVGFTIRIHNDLLKILRFIAADQETSMNALMVDFLQKQAEQHRISLPSGLLLEQGAVGEELRLWKVEGLYNAMRKKEMNV
ncbi:hypothetical protein AGMMS50276_28520 [Synergistales bacterium]|nr:hypothetical protein AGMMS50276_28520 [Synergistales bacterium]